MGVIGRQFSSPSGSLGRLAGLVMARRNAALNRLLIAQVASRIGPPRVLAELGFGPGVSLSALLATFPDAQVVGVDPSADLAGRAAARNRIAVQAGRLRLLQGDVSVLAPYAPIDLILAVHVLYFWHDPVSELKAIATLLRPGGDLALGYRLRQDMPTVAQQDFPREGHRLYESDREVAALLDAAGLAVRHEAVFGRADSPAGRLLLASRG
jgi:trans-aconitate methyltransferase